MVDTSGISGQLEALRQQQATSLAGRQGAIAGFFDDKQRLRDIEAQTQPLLQRNIANLQQQGREGSRNIGLQNAMNMGGSVQQQQLGNLSQAVNQQGLAIGGQHSANVQSLRDLLTQQRAQQEQQAFQMSGFQNQGLQSLNHGLGGAIQGVQQGFIDQNRTDAGQQEISNQMSRGFGNMLGLASRNVTLHNDALGMGRNGLI